MGQSSGDVDREQSCLKASIDDGLAAEKSRDGTLLFLPPGAGTLNSSVLAGAIFRCW
jgi:hypothetical protein